MLFRSAFSLPVSENGKVRLHLNSGRRHRIRPGDIVGALTSEADINGRAIGAIEMFDGHAIVEIDHAVAAQVLERAGQLVLRGRPTTVMLADLR